MGTNSKVLLRSAVENSVDSRRSLFLQKLFTLWFHGFVYNQIWEDPIVDAKALELNRESRIVTIGSGGCNVLSYLTFNPEKISVVDINPFHMSLVRLKLCAVRTLPTYKDFHRMFAIGAGKQNIANYQQYIEHALDEESRRFWSGGSLRQVLSSPRIDYFRKNFYAHSRSGLFIRFLHMICRVAGCKPEKILKANSREEQEMLFKKYLEPVFKHWIVRSLGRLPFMLYSLGIPPQQFKELSEGEGSLIDSYRERVRRLCCDFPIKENYFAAQALSGSYLHDQESSLPEYLKEKHFAQLKESVDRVDTNIVGFSEFLKSQADNSYTSFVLLDSQDWMTPRQLEDLWQEIARVGKPHSRVIFRTAGKSSPIDDALSVELRSTFHYHHVQSHALHKEDRSAVYGGFHIYELTGKRS